jgi:drug/metabolite transporter (DMT)-like permease
LLWQPAVIAMLFILGLIFTFLAVERGEVSIATPVFGIKVVFVALLLTVFGEEQLPAAVWYAAALATVGIGLIQWTKLRDHKIQRFLLPGVLLIALQAICIVFTISFFGNAARVNVVYSLRGLWSVALAWAVAKIWGGAESDLPRKVLLTRLAGACLLTAAVTLVIVSRR